MQLVYPYGVLVVDDREHHNSGRNIHLAFCGDFFGQFLLFYFQKQMGALTKWSKSAFIAGALAAILSIGQLIISQDIIFPVDASLREYTFPASGDMNKMSANVMEEISFSACLLIMDDNHRLVEWLAYHWFVLPLRYLIVAVDPNSRTSPREILNRWRKMGMTIVEWSDYDFWNNTATHPEIYSGLSTADETQNMTQKTSQYLMRQNVFIKQCMIHMKEQNKKWVTFHDVDEYLGYNHPSGTDAFHIWELEQRNLSEQKPLRLRTVRRILPSHPPPALSTQGAFLPFLEREIFSNITQLKVPCISIPRLQFGAMESTEEQRFSGIPLELDAKRFDTIRWHYHADLDDIDKNGLNKVIIDMSRISVEDIEVESKTGRGRRRNYNPHRPLFRRCNSPTIMDHESIFRINHYLGSWDVFSFRDDPRKGTRRTSRDGWEFLSQSATKGPNVWLRPWLRGFIDLVGSKKAVTLLKDSGLPRNFTSVSSSTSWVFNHKRHAPTRADKEWQIFLEGKNKGN